MVRSPGMAQTLPQPEQVDDLVARYRDGTTLVELASRFGIHGQTVTEHPDAAGGSDPPRTIRPFPQS